MLTAMTAMVFAPVRWLVGRLMPPGTGPSRERRESGFFVVRSVGVAKAKVRWDTHTQRERE
jgi:short subunit dehydrogenase-like uncharacterized protein